MFLYDILIIWDGENMRFKLFKGKVVTEENDETKNNDILDDFTAYERNKELEKNIDDTISSFQVNFSEGIDNKTNNNLDSNISISKEEENDSLNNLTFSYNDIDEKSSSDDSNYPGQTNTEIYNIEPFNPYINNMGTYDDFNNQNEIEQEDTNNQNTFDDYSEHEPTIDISNSEDVNVALSNIYNQSVTDNKTEDSKPIMENIVNTSEKKNIVSTPIYENPYKNSITDPGYKICPKCGQKIREDYKQCFVCGTII